MEHKLINHFTKIASLSSLEMDSLKNSMTVVQYTKNDFLCKEGQLKQDSFFILEGFVRQYKLIDGEEITTDFYTTDQWILSLHSFNEKKGADDYLVCLDDTTVVIGNEEKAQALFKDFPRFETIARQVMENVFFEKQERMHAYLTDTPEQRYLKLLNRRPDIFQYVPLYQIASYIGVKPESLSRIRKRVSTKF
jgi:CRP-like cAMP-binding protein